MTGIAPLQRIRLMATMYLRAGLLALMTTASLLTGCSSHQVLTKQQVAIQNAADAQVALILFESDLEDAASYNIRKDGFVVVRFHESVSARDFTMAVGAMRSRPEITGVRAEQSGREICPLRPGG